jgi:hypothetical protein
MYFERLAYAGLEASDLTRYHGVRETGDSLNLNLAAMDARDGI